MKSTQDEITDDDKASVNLDPDATTFPYKRVWGYPTLEYVSVAHRAKMALKAYRDLIADNSEVIICKRLRVVCIVEEK